MNGDDNTQAASASGILGCLRLLEDEAASLGLHRTRSAIAEALAAARQESGAMPVPDAWPAAEHKLTH